MKSIVFDLDGTLADYTGGWPSHADFPGDILPHTKDQIQRLKTAGYDIGIYSTRNTDMIAEWVSKNRMDNLIDWININPNNPPGTSNKPIGCYYIDDRAITFNNNLIEIVDFILCGD